MSKRHIYGMVFMVFSLLLVLTPRHIAPTCHLTHEGMLMQCHHMGNAVMGVAAVLMVLALLFMTVKDDKTALGLIYSQTLIGILVIMLPWKIIGTCASPSMLCNLHTKPAITLLSGLYVFINIFYIWRNRNEFTGNKMAV